MNSTDIFWSRHSRVSYFWLEQKLDDDNTFRQEALAVLQHVNPNSTHTEASSAMELLNRWTVHRELLVYYRGERVADVCAVDLFPDENGDYTPAANAVEQDWRIDRAEFEALLKQYEMTVPSFLSGESPVTDTPLTEDKPKPAPPPPKYWIMRIQAEAATRWRNLRRQGCSPTKLALKDDLAKWCQDHDVVTDTTAITPSPSYIYRHVLRRWTPPKDD